MATWTVTGSPVFNGDSSCSMDSTDRFSGPAALLDKTTGWFAARIRLGFTAGAAPNVAPKALYFELASSGYVQCIYEASGQAWRIQRFNGAAGPGTLDVSDPVTTGDKRTVVWAWTATNVLLSVGGAAFTSAAGGTVPTAAAVGTNIGNDSVDSRSIGSDFFWCCGGLGTLVDADAATLNAFGDSDPSWPSFGTPTFLWPATDADYQTESGVEMQSYYAFRRRSGR
jgi:hypothetical protein